jgi:acyl-coenzyme A thioesterase PaaI-like protein
MDKAGYRQIPRRENDNNCFGCSPNNSSGLQLQFFTDGKKICSWLRVPKHLSGWDHLVHGGVITTMLDEVMGWYILHLLRKMPLTKTIAVKFLKPVYVDEDIRIEGVPFKIENERKAVIQGFLYNKDNEVCAMAKGVFALFTVDTMRKRGIMNDKILQNIEQIISGSKIEKE